MSVFESLVNGRRDDRISIHDRGLQFGDGLFETIAVRDGTALHLRRHMQRLSCGCRRLAIAHLDIQALTGVLQDKARDYPEAVIKLMVTRGLTERGYAADADLTPSLIVKISDYPDWPQARSQQGITVQLCETRLAAQPQLAGIKHLNRLEQVLARREWRGPSIQEGLLFDHDGNLVEASMSNVFLVMDDTLVTPDLSACGVAGVMRSVILDLARRDGMQIRVQNIPREALATASEVFLCNSLIGIWTVREIRHMAVYGAAPVTAHLRRRLLETAGHDVSETWYPA